MNIVDAMLRTLLRAAVQAPSSTNAQPWLFAVVQQRETLARYSDLVAIGSDAHAYAYADCGLAAEALMLAAYAQGLGSCRSGFAVS